jgi:hypothetical protein
MLGQRRVGEVDDVDIEMDGVAARAGGKQIQRAACGGLRIGADLIDRDEVQAEFVDLTTLELGRPGAILADQCDLIGTDNRPRSAAASTLGSLPSIASMCPSAIQSSAPSEALSGVLRSECRSK